MNPARNSLPLTRRQALTLLAFGAAAPTVVAACALHPDRQPPIRQPALNLTPADNSRDVMPTAVVQVQVNHGVLQQVMLTNISGIVVAGQFNSDRSTFTITEPLGYGKTYTWSGSAIGQNGQVVPITGSFTTLNPDTQVRGQFQLSDGQNVGIAAPIILQFDAVIDNAYRADVERALTVTTQPFTVGSWAWLPDEAQGSRVHWRPREYFQAETIVHVDAQLYAVPCGENSYGATDSTLDFTIGRRQIVKADAPSHRIQVITDDGVIMDFPCSYGEGDLPRNVTRSGIHVVTEKYADFYMSNPAAGYRNLRERWAVRISNNGEFIHANPASSGAQGNTNVTNGCINLSIEDAEQYYYSARYGDPVEVSGTSIALSYADGDIWDWAVSWDDWVAMSALNPKPAPLTIPKTAPATPTDAPTLSGTPTPAVPNPLGS